MSFTTHSDKLIVPVLMFQLGGKFQNPVLCIGIASRQWYKVLWLIYTWFSHDFLLMEISDMDLHKRENLV